jgi:para-nitrobenzyl esterase
MVDGDVVPERPMEAFRRGRAHRVPLVIGTTDREGALFRGRVDILPRTPARIRTIFERAPAPARALMSTAYPGLPAGRVAADFAGDYGFWYPSIVVADRHARFAPVHAYRFDTAPRLLHMLGLDATHGIDLFALFDQTGTALGRTVTAFGGRVSFAQAGDRMRRHWLDFATTGSVSAGWPAYSAELRTTLIIDSEDRIEVDPRRTRRLAWGSFLPDL